jgi:transcription-repair coupling factor (superfamily II helicase)
VDIPNVNTIIVDDADLFGLADLHQLRGRVGRYKHQAFAYFLLPADRPVTPDGAKRLKAIEEFSQLGAGFRIARRDLELRGAGNLLGPEQHGHIFAVGYELYCQMLEQEVRKLQGKPVAREVVDTTVEIPCDAYLPEDYVPWEKERVDFYRRVSRCTTEEGLEELLKQARDRFGKPPLPVQNLFLLQRVRIRASRWNIYRLKLTERGAELKFANAQQANRFSRKAKGARQLDAVSCMVNSRRRGRKLLKQLSLML